MKNAIFVHWKTTAAGIIAAVCQVAAHGASAKWVAVATALLGIVASDSKS